MTLSIQGLGDVIFGLDKAVSTVKQRVADATKEAAEDLAEDARSNAPVLTGTLRNSIEVTVRGTTVEVGSTARYGGFVEYGTWKDAPQPFMGPAADRQAPEYVKALEEIAEDI